MIIFNPASAPLGNCSGRALNSLSRSYSLQIIAGWNEVDNLHTVVFYTVQGFIMICVHKFIT